MAHRSPDTHDEPEPFRLHVHASNLRTVVGFETVDEALKAAFDRLDCDSDLRAWISDSARNIVLDSEQVRSRFARWQMEETR